MNGFEDGIPNISFNKTNNTAVKQIDTVPKYDRTTIVAAAYIRPPYSYPCVLETPITCRYKGINMDLFHQLMSLLGYDYRVVPAADNISGYYDNGTIRGILGQIARKEVDMSATVAAVDADQLDIVDFSAPVTYIDYGFLIRKPKGTYANPSLLKFFLSPFSHTVWMYLVAIVLCTVVAYFVGEALQSYTKAKVATHKPCSAANVAGVIANSFFQIYRSVTGQSYAVFTKSSFKSQRFFMCLWELWLFFMVVIYHGQLTGELLVSSRTKNQPFTTLKEVADLVYDKSYSFVTDRRRGMFIPIPESQADKSNPREKIQVAMNWNPVVYANDTRHLVDLIVNSSADLVYYTSYYSVQDATALSCDLLAIRVEHSQSRWLSLMFRKHTELADIFSMAFYNHENSVHGYFNSLYKKYHKTPVVCQNYRATRGVKDEYGAVNIGTFKEAVVCLLTGALLAFCIFGAEVLFGIYYLP